MKLRLVTIGDSTNKNNTILWRKKTIKRDDYADEEDARVRLDTNEIVQTLCADNRYTISSLIDVRCVIVIHVHKHCTTDAVQVYI